MSIFTSGTLFVEGGSGGAGSDALGRGALRSAGVSSTSVMVHLKGGTFDNIAITIKSSSESTAKRFQLMPTSQFA